MTSTCAPSSYDSNRFHDSRRQTDSVHSAVVSYLYRAFGEQTVLSGSDPNRFTWVGRLGYYRQPDTGDYWVRARVYEPTIGRWRRDPLSIASASAAGVLADTYCDLLWPPPPYKYASNGPTLEVDPSGNLGLLAAYHCARGSASWAWREAEASQLPGKYDGKRDAYRHCIWACRMTARCGVRVAHVVLAGHELVTWDDGKVWSPQLTDPAGSLMDTHNNNVGMAEGEGLGCKERNNPEKSCKKRCTQRLQARGLITAVPREGSL